MSDCVRSEEKQKQLQIFVNKKSINYQWCVFSVGRIYAIHYPSYVIADRNVSYLEWFIAEN